jgi:hypothetical protein
VVVANAQIAPVQGTCKIARGPEGDAMAMFTTRIELRNAKDSDYETLRK